MCLWNPPLLRILAARLDLIMSSNIVLRIEYPEGVGLSLAPQHARAVAMTMSSCPADAGAPFVICIVCISFQSVLSTASIIPSQIRSRR